MDTFYFDGELALANFINYVKNMKVFKFLNSEFAMKAIAEQRLKISRFDDLNDPFELFPANVSDPKIRKVLTEFKRANMAVYGLLCFSRHFSNPLLWSHYANHHRGVALEFEISNQDVLEVNYHPVRLLLNFQDLARSGGLRESDLESFLATKFEHWKYEDEVRTICRLGAAEKDGDLYFETFSNTLKLVRVVLGAACTLSDEEISGNLPAGMQLTITNTKLSFDSYAIEMDESLPERIIES